MKTTFETANIPAGQLDELEQFAQERTDPELRAALLLITRFARDSSQLIVSDATQTLTPNEAAKRLGMSRTHLYKLLDAGEIPFHNVGRDRRIEMRDLVAFEEKRDTARRELAERFAHQRATTKTAVDELAAEL
ncbi:helix-turn-helix domain-containing protein [Kribbella endophytica]